MIIFAVNNVQISPSNLWYHYNDIHEVTDVFEVKISRNESELIQLFEDYCSCKIDASNITKKVITIDSLKRSYGLMWHILNYAKKNNNESNTYDWEWILNSIKNIAVDANFISINGVATKYKGNENDG